jgi:hypothetical protein
MPPLSVNIPTLTRMVNILSHSITVATQND